MPAIIIAMIAVDWTVYARLSRAEALTLRQRDFVLAARLLGYSQRRIVARHVLPGVLRVSAAYAVADVVLIVIVTASLSFLGVGVQAPTPEWGSIMYEGRSVLSTDPVDHGRAGRGARAHRTRAQPRRRPAVHRAGEAGR